MGFTLGLGEYLGDGPKAGEVFPSGAEIFQNLLETISRCSGLAPLEQGAGAGDLSWDSGIKNSEFITEDLKGGDEKMLLCPRKQRIKRK